MTKEQLFEAIGQIDERRLEASETDVPAKILKFNRVWGSLIACACVLILVVTVVPNAFRMGSSGPKYESATEAPAAAPALTEDTAEEAMEYEIAEAEEEVEEAAIVEEAIAEAAEEEPMTSGAASSKPATGGSVNDKNYAADMGEVIWESAEHTYCRATPEILDSFGIAPDMTVTSDDCGDIVFGASGNTKPVPLILHYKNRPDDDMILIANLDGEYFFIYAIEE